jgi:hypothetical protein
VATPEQNDANRRNSQRSKGPKTPEGKARSAKNALKHGLLSSGVLLPGEDAEAFAELSRSLSEDLKPVGALELVLVDRLIDQCWRLQRARKFEAGILAWYQADLAVKRFERKTYRAQHAASPEITSEPPLTELLRLHKETDLATTGEIYIDDARRINALATLARNETSLERSFFKTLHELERRQALRQGKEVAVPLVVDIDVSGAEPEDLRIIPARSSNAAD